MMDPTSRLEERSRGKGKLWDYPVCTYMRVGAKWQATIFLCLLDGAFENESALDATRKGAEEMAAQRMCIRMGLGMYKQQEAQALRRVTKEQAEVTSQVPIKLQNTGLRRLEKTIRDSTTPFAVDQFFVAVSLSPSSIAIHCAPLTHILYSDPASEPYTVQVIATHCCDFGVLHARVEVFEILGELLRWNEVVFVARDVKGKINEFGQRGFVEFAGMESVDLADACAAYQSEMGDVGGVVEGQELDDMMVLKTLLQNLQGESEGGSVEAL